MPGKVFREYSWRLLLTASSPCLSALYPVFVDPSNATVARVADHVEHIASVCGRAHVGLGSDFNGISASVEGLDDVSQWPNMVSSAWSWLGSLREDNSPQT